MKVNPNESSRSRENFFAVAFGLETLEAEGKCKYKELSKIILPTNFADKFCLPCNLFEQNWNGAVSRFR